MIHLIKRIFLIGLLWPVMALATQGPQQAVTIHIEGMTCSLCVTAINKALRSLAQVSQAKTSLKKSEAIVHVPENYELNKLLAEIESTGYHGTIQSVQPLAMPQP